MCKSLLCAQFILALSINFCLAQSNGIVLPPAWLETNTPKNVNWGEPVRGVQLSIITTNRLVIASSMTLVLRIKNASTNVIYLQESDPLKDTVVLLIHSSGRVIHLTPGRKPDDQYWRHFIIPLKPGQIYKWSLEIGIGKDIEPVKYVMSAIRDFAVDGDGFMKKDGAYNVLSNRLEEEASRN